MNRALATRLERLEAAAPAPMATPTLESGRLKLKLDGIVAAVERFSALSPRQQIVELRAELRAERAPRSAPLNPNAVKSGLSAKLEKIDLDFRDVTERHLRDAEIALLAELGHPNARHPLTPELQEILDLELFDA